MFNKTLLKFLMVFLVKIANICNFKKELLELLIDTLKKCLTNKD